MRLALPVTVKFLHKGNKELCRNLSSYLSLAAINNAELLSKHIQPIIDSIISGKFLPQQALFFTLFLMFRKCGVVNLYI